MTIQFCGLNRLALVQERTALLRRLEFLRDAMFQIDTAARNLHDSVALAAPELADKLAGTARLLDSLGAGVLHEILAALDPHQPYATLARRWLERWADTLDVNPDPTPWPQPPPKGLEPQPGPSCPKRSLPTVGTL